MRVNQPVGFLALEIARQQPAGAAGQFGHVGAPLVEDQVEACAQPVPALLECRDARFGRFRARWCRRKVLPVARADPYANHSI
jgi:hypothetical protein